ncbi:hypothetical protein A2154_00020 [Candidatus Gottesmanbacteria bacterium RBG_16_43_7]|uniref:Glycosyltransferase RgtA/B/C/D-like domain-containing protein n=1 Tax=Candidatus Gottesmanbacteria bacterium RBG_16_43_7 TaxID=1798373 RepID=A0A1F5ZB79_9BACT|nr:MAG: hypothetical protein A2154_00020 [Candidatus Gottesmanbacteria bacterium RBG_16_43_7]
MAGKTQNSKLKTQNLLYLKTLIASKENYPHIVLSIVSCLLLLIFLWWHWRLGMVRYFDADELAHLHYSAQLLSGRRPYVDFLMFFPPGFILFLAPAFAWGWGTTAPFLAARYLLFLVFSATCLIIGLLFWEQRRSWLAPAAAAILAFIPMPLDKYLEIRPDNLATLLLLLGMYLQIRWMKGAAQSAAAASGILYSLSAIVLTKMVPNVAATIFIAMIYLGLAGKGNLGNRIKAGWEYGKYFFIGLVVPVLLTFIWMLSLGDLGTVWYSLTSLTIESNKISRYFIMMPDLFFYPNGIYYGLDGWSRGLLVNHGLWIIGILIGIYRLLTPYLTKNPKSKNSSYAHATEDKQNPNKVQISKSLNMDEKTVFTLSEILIGLQLAVGIVFYVLLVPLKHAQYLIPVAVFIAYYCADGLDSLWQQLRKFKTGVYVYGAIFATLAFFLYQVFIEINTIKLSWTNTDFLSHTQELYNKIPQNEPVLDLDGKILYNPDAYYACCIPFGQFSEFLSRPLPDLSATLENKAVKYINQGGLKRVRTLSYQDQVYINANYHSFFGDETILVRNGNN